VNKRETYNSIIAEIEGELNKVTTNIPEDYVDMVNSNSSRTISVDKGVILKSATSAFANYAVRDGLMVRATTDPEFSLVLVAKIGNYISAKDSKAITQDDIEAMATASQISAIWGQEWSANYFVKSVEELTKINKELTEPSLITITKMLLNAGTERVASIRTNTMSQLSDKVNEALGE
jgi:hypothetical protein